MCLEGVFRTSRELRERGLPRPAARTWYGALFGERIGVTTLAQAGAKPCGESVLLDLVAEPWSATIPQLFERQSVLFAQLRQTGMFAERELNEKGHAVKTASGTAWEPPPWVLDLHDKRGAKDAQAE